MQQLLYVSVARTRLNPQAVMQLVSSSRRRNGLHGITGTLVSSRYHFFQLLEGEGADIETIFGAIRQDPRHRAVLQLGRRHTLTRLLPDEHMGYSWADRDDRNAHLGAAVTNMVRAIADDDLRVALSRFARIEQLA